MSSPLISVVVPSYNSEKYIGDCIKSILSQSYSNFELIVVDDCSTDNTLGVLAPFRKDKRVKVFVNDVNKGAGVCRNIGIENATGSYLAFIDSDDLWSEFKLENQLEFMQKNQASITFTPFSLIDGDGNHLGKTVDLGNMSSVSYHDLLLKRVTFGCSTVMLNRHTLGHVRMPQIRTGQDYATWLSILREGHTALCLDQALTLYRITPGSISRNKFKKAIRQWQIYRRIEKLGFFMAAWCFSNYAIRAVFRR